MKSKLAIKRELTRVERLRKLPQTPENATDHNLLQGAEQALAWALEQNAAAPTRCMAYLGRRKGRKP